MHNTTRWTAWTVASAMSLAGSLASAQPREHGRHHAHKLKHLQAELELTDAQLAELKTALREGRRAARGADEAASEKPWQRRHAHHQRMRAAFERVLTPAQLSKLETLHTERMQRREQKRLDRLTEELSLSAAQREAVSAAFEAHRPDHAAMHSTGAKQVRAARKVSRQQLRETLRGILSSEQYARFETLQAERRERRRARRGQRHHKRRS